MNPNSEPVSWGGAITALAIAVIPFLRAFEVNISEQQGDAIMTLLAAIIVVGTVILRSRVTPQTKAVDAIVTGLNTSPTGSQVGDERQATSILANTRP